MSKIIEIKDLSYSYISKAPVIKEISINVQKGIFLGIVGPNGVGKSTLLNLLCGTIKANSGNIKIDSKPIGSYTPKSLAKKVAVVRQDISSVFGFSVLETVLMARIIYYNQMGFQSKKDIQIAMESLEATDTIQFAHRQLSSLSGGERQRVFIARALAQDTPILLLDEPTSFLDMKHQVGIYDLLKDAQASQNKTIAAVTHDINLAVQYCDELLILPPDNNYVYGTPKEVLSPEQISKVFGIQVMAGNISGKDFFIPQGKHTKY